MKNEIPLNYALSAALLMLVGGCNRGSPLAGDSPATAEATLPPLCAGGDTVSLAARFHSTATSPAEERFVTEPGYRFLVVNADCEYWVNEQSWFTRHGVLTEEEASTLSKRLHYAELGALDGTWRGDCYDPPILSIVAAGHEMRCECDCSGAGVPADVADVARGFRELLPELAAQGANWSGPASLLVLEDSTLDDQDALPWPPSVDVEDVLLDHTAYRNTIQGGLPLPGVVISAETADPFRQLMTEYAKRHPDRAVAGDPMPLFQGEKYYGVYLRDEL